MVVGVGLFGVFTGFVASWFVGSKNEESEKLNKESNSTSE
jgi:hypothetical protein